MTLPFARSFGFGSIILAKKFLLAALPASLVISAAAASNAPVSAYTPLPERWQTLSPSKASRMMRDIERRVNATNPRYPVVILDDDTVNLRPTNNTQSQRNRIEEVLNDRGISLRWNQKSDVMSAMGYPQGPTERNPQAIRLRADDYSSSNNPLDQGVIPTQVCIVITPVADISSRNLINKWIGHKAGAELMKAKGDPGAYAMMLRATWHEVWHCLDPYFYKESYSVVDNKALDNSYDMHRAEVFADIAATLTLVTTYPEIIRYMSDIRAISSDHESRESRRGARPSDEEYYNGAIYYFTKALDLLEEHVRTVGIDRVSQYSLQEIGEIAREITVRGALTKIEIKHMTDSIVAGAVPTERVRLAKERLLERADASVANINSRPPFHLSAAEILHLIPDSEKSEILEKVSQAVDRAVAEGKMPEQGVIDLIDQWRDKVHGTDTPPILFEKKLYTLSLMLSQGKLENILRRQESSMTNLRQARRDKDRKPEGVAPS